MGTFLKSLSLMIHSCTGSLERGNITPFSKAMGELTGTGCTASSPSRLQQLLSHDLKLCREIKYAWAAMRLHIPDTMPLEDRGMLANTVEAAGMGMDHRCNVQKELTYVWEKACYSVLEAEVKQLRVGTGGSMKDWVAKMSFFSHDRLSGVWLTCFPSEGLCTSPPAFREAMAVRMGVASPCCKGLVGEQVYTQRGTTRKLDRFGVALSSSGNIDAHYMTRHEAALGVLVEGCEKMGIPIEVSPYHCLTEAIPPEHRVEYSHTLERLTRRSGRIPDAKVSVNAKEVLVDVKVINLNDRRYKPAYLADRAVNVRAKDVAKEYEASARKLDERFNAHPQSRTDPGPALHLLRSYGHGSVVGWVFGVFGEACDDVYSMLNYIAERGAMKLHRSMNAPSVGVAKQAILWKYSRQLSVAVVRENARVKLDRLRYVGATGRSAYARRRYQSMQTARKDDDGGADIFRMYDTMRDTRNRIPFGG